MDPAPSLHHFVFIGYPVLQAQAANDVQLMMCS